MQNDPIANPDTEIDYLAILDATPSAEQYPLVQKWMKQESLNFLNSYVSKDPY